MFGSTLFQWVHGQIEHIGYYGTTNLALPDSSVNSGVLPKGTFVDGSADDTPDNAEAVLASGSGFLGVLVQDVDTEGLTGDSGFKKFTIGKLDNPVKQGAKVSIRKPMPNGQAEFEGLGTAQPGNLVCTSGTGSLSSGTAKETELSLFNGALRVAQTGDLVVAHMMNANVTPKTSGNLRIRVKFVSPYVAD